MLTPLFIHVALKFASTDAGPRWPPWGFDPRHARTRAATNEVVFVVFSDKASGADGGGRKRGPRGRRLRKQRRLVQQHQFPGKLWRLGAAAERQPDQQLL